MKSLFHRFIHSILRLSVLRNLSPRLSLSVGNRSSAKSIGFLMQMFISMFLYGGYCLEIQTAVTFATVAGKKYRYLWIPMMNQLSLDQSSSQSYTVTITWMLSVIANSLHRSYQLCKSRIPYLHYRCVENLIISARTIRKCW